MFWVCSYMCEGSGNTFEETALFFPEIVMVVEDSLPSPDAAPSGGDPLFSDCPPVCKMPMCTFLALGVLVDLVPWWQTQRNLLCMSSLLARGRECVCLLPPGFETHCHSPFVFGFCYIWRNQYYAVLLLKCFVVEEQAAGGPEQIVTM